MGGAKGGVGKTLVACGLAIELSRMGERVGLLDLDLHGASVPTCLGIRPPLSSDAEGLVPKKVGELLVMSVGLLTGDRPLPIRGNDKQGLVSQLFSLTDWGGLDILVVDLPPGLGDELLSSFALFAGKASLLLVTTPSAAAVAVTSRMAKLAKNEGVRVDGIVLNMASLRVGASVSWPFGRADRAGLERRLGARMAAELPLEPALAVKSLLEVLGEKGRLARALIGLAEEVKAS